MLLGCSLIIAGYQPQMGRRAMAKATYRQDGQEQTLASRMMEPDAIGRAVSMGDTDEISARIDAATLYDSGPKGPYTLDEQRRRKLQLGKTAASALAEFAADGIGENLKMARQRARITQAEAAQAAGISRDTVQRIERGTRAVNLREALMFATIYGTHIERVLGIIDADAEHLLDVYEAATPTNRKHIVRAAEMIQGGTYKAAADASHKDFVAHLQGIIDNPSTPDGFREATVSMLARILNA